MARPVALVLNASDFGGQPAVAALLGAGYLVFASDAVFSDAARAEAFHAAYPGVEVLGGSTPEEWVAEAWRLAGRVDALISNDHFPAVQTATEAADVEALRATLEALVVAPFRAIRMAIPLLKAQGGGNIVMVTSCRTKLPIPGGAIPDAARDAANALMRSLAIELAPFDIAVNAVAPNFLYSEAYYPRAIFIDDPKGRAFVEASVPAKRLGRPEEIGEIILFLASTKARFMTGAQLDFSGGWPAAPVRPS